MRKYDQLVQYGSDYSLTHTSLSSDNDGDHYRAMFKLNTGTRGEFKDAALSGILPGYALMSQKSGIVPVDYSDLKKMLQQSPNEKGYYTFSRQENLRARDVAAAFCEMVSQSGNTRFGRKNVTKEDVQLADRLRKQYRFESTGQRQMGMSGLSQGRRYPGGQLGL